MIQRTLLRQSRAWSSSIRSSPRSSLARPQFRPSYTPLSQALRQTTLSRWYSTEPEAKKDIDGEKKADEVDPANNELEAKNKEIIELKVCATLYIPPFIDNTNRIIG
jgi:molecular chaperone GrpE